MAPFLMLLLMACTEATDTDVHESNDSENTNPDAGALFIGHSQVNHNVPAYFAWMSPERNVERQVIGGGNLEEAYVLHAQYGDQNDPGADPDHKYMYFPGRFSGKGADALQELSTGDYGVVVMTDEHGQMQAQAHDADFMARHGVSFPGVEFVDPGGDQWMLDTYQSTDGIASGLGLYQHAVDADPQARVYLYEHWYPVVNGATHCQRVNGGQPTKTLDELNAWRKRIAAYQSAFEGVATDMNAARGQEVPGFSYGAVDLPRTQVHDGPAVEVIHVAQAFSVAVERICAGGISGVDNPGALFADHVHASLLGDFFVAAVMKAAVDGASPEGAELVGSAPFFEGSWAERHAAATEAALRALAWEVVSGAVVASSVEISSCPGLAPTPEQWCMDDGDHEIIPMYP